MEKTFNFSSDFAILNIAHLFGHTQQKIWNILLSFVFKNLCSQKEHKISIARLLNSLNMRDSNKVKEKLLGMTKNPNTPHLFYYYFETLNISNDTIFYSYPDELLMLLENQSIYEITNDLLQFNFSTKYSLFLYEFCAYYNYFGINQIVPLRVFRNYLGISSAQYNNFKSFENKILIHALYEINTQTDISVSIKPEKESNNIIGLKLNIKNRNSKNNLPSPSDFLLQNIALARYYKVSQSVRDGIKELYTRSTGQQFMSINDSSYKKFIIQRFIAPFEIVLIEEMLGYTESFVIPTEQQAALGSVMCG